MTEMASAFSCKRCADILKTGSQQDCDRCCRKLHPTCSGLPGDVYYQLRSSKKTRWTCDLCSAWQAKKGEDSRAARQISYFNNSAIVYGPKLMKKSKSTADLDLIESVSSTFGNILNQLTEMKEINKNMSDHIRKLSESQSSFGQSIEEGLENTAREECNKGHGLTSNLPSSRDDLNTVLEKPEDKEVASSNIKKVAWKEETMETDLDEVFEEDSVDELSNVDCWRRNNNRLSLKQSSVEFDFGLNLPLRSDQAERNFVSIASVSTLGRIYDPYYSCAVDIVNTDYTENSKLSLSSEDIVQHVEDSIGDYYSSISIISDTKYEDPFLIKHNSTSFSQDENETHVEINSFNDSECQENMLITELSTQDNTEVGVSTEDQLNQNLYSGGSFIDLCDSEVISIFEAAEERCARSAMVAQLQPAQLSEWMDAEAARRQRIAHYKEERRRQLAAQYGPQDPASSSSGGSGGGVSVRSTRASRLRSAAATATNSPTDAVKTGGSARRDSAPEKREVNGRLGQDVIKERTVSSARYQERDKSSKRKSNLNRSINSEPAEDVLRRRRSVTSPAKTGNRPAPDADSPRSTPSRGQKRVTPPRESPRSRPRSSSGVVETERSATPPETPPVDPPPLPDVVTLPSRRSSILKKKSIDESSAQPFTVTAKPVSILKRKTSQEEGSVVVPSQPVTFSPSVVEPSSSAFRRQGILKKHRSLDEGVGGGGRRSASPDKPILKPHRRSSLEEVRRRTQSPEPQSILKRKTSREEATESCNTTEPQGILKRKTSSCSSNASVHMTIAESVILAVAGESLPTDDHVRPILKKKSSMCEEPPGISLDNSAQGVEPPRPILKKKSSSETEENEEKPKKPILKSRRDSGRVSESRQSFTDHETTEEVRTEDVPLLNGTEENVELPSALSAQAESSSPERCNVLRRVNRIVDPDAARKRRSLDSWVRFREESVKSTCVKTSLSVAERVMNMESFLAMEADAQRPRSVSPNDATENKGAVPKRIRDRERFRTQPVTVEELILSRSWSREEGAMQAAEGSVKEPPLVPLARSDSVSARASLFEAQLKKKDEATSPKRAVRGSAARRVKVDPSRFQTQPVTQDEVEEAKKINDAANPSAEDAEDDDPNDPSKLSLAERVKLFNQKMVSERLTPRSTTRSNRFKTQPVTTEEVVTAQKMGKIGLSRTASSILVSGILKNLTEKNEGPKPKSTSKESSESEDDDSSEPSSPQKRGILKSPSLGWRNSLTESTDVSETSNLKSMLKKENKNTTEVDLKSKDLHSILKVTKSRGSSSSEESESDSEDDKPNANSDLIDLLHKVEAQARSERKINVSPERRKPPQILPNNKKLEESDKLMNLKNLDQEKENYDVTRRFRRKKDGSEVSEGDSSSSGGREVQKIIRNEAVARRRQAGIAREAAAERVKRLSGGEGSLFKSRSHAAMNGEVVLRPPSGPEPSPLRRCRTQPMDECDEPHHKPPVSIAQRLEALQKRGQTDWKKRISRLNPEEELTTTISINAAAQVLQERLSTTSRPTTDDHSPTTTPLDERLGLLESSTQGWRKRVLPSDASQFSVAGRMAPVPRSPLLSPALERRKKTPKPERFRSKGVAAGKDVQSMPTSPDADTTHGIFKRSISAPGGDDDNSLSPVEGEVVGPLVTVPQPFDDDFSNFFASSATDERIELRDEDLEKVTNSTSQLLVQRRTVKVQRRRGASSNPVKALAARTDLRTEYVEVKSGVAQREEKRLRVEKLAKNSPMAIEALAGLASQEDFAAVQLRRTAESTVHLSPMLPYKDLMLLQVKGRRHVQTRLVRPHYTSVNRGDSYVLVTPSQVFHLVGEFSNVIERSRGAEVAQHIAATRDLGCAASQVTTLQGCHTHRQFWTLLGADDAMAATYTGAEAGHPDEDEMYELSLTDTNMVYEVQGEDLVPRDDCWGVIPKIEVLDHNKVLVFDFGAELYVWMGKTVSLDRRRTALKLGQELWAQGYDYSECDICPLTQAELLGTRTDVTVAEKRSSSRPDWALLAKVTQHMETVLFREKFLDWPDFSRVIQVKARNHEKQVDGSVEVKPCDAQPMVDWTPPEPDLQLEGSHLGRGTKYYDIETHRHFEISTTSVTVWHIQEFESTELTGSSVGQFHSGDSYVIRWCYTVTVSGRELTGQPSRHSTMGRDRCAYFTWQGADASRNDSGAAALLTVQLDQERGPQLRVEQGAESPALRGLFEGGMVIHKGRRNEESRKKGPWRLYIVLGEEVREAVLAEVTCSVKQLRSRACLVLLNTDTGHAFLWRGSQALPHTRQVASAAVDKLKEHRPVEAGLEDVDSLTVEEITEGAEPRMFFEGLGGHNRQLYESLSLPVTRLPRMFCLSSVSGQFQATPVSPACHHTDLATPFPYTQQELYSARQPALFLMDGGERLWLWQGWWPTEQSDDSDSDEQSPGSVAGAGEVRWQAERRAAMHTALQYARLSGREPHNALLVWAGLEPAEFTNLFPTWSDRDDIAELNIRDGRKPGEHLPVEEELERLTQSTYPPAQLLQRPLPEGVDPTRLEEYLAPHHFQEVLGLSQDDFLELPAWKKNQLKQEKGLF